MARYIDADKLCEGLKGMASVQEPYKQNTILGVVSTIENFPPADVAPRAEVAREIFEVIAKMFFEKQKQYENSHQSGKARQMMVARFEVYKLKKKYAEPEPPKGG